MAVISTVIKTEHHRTRQTPSAVVRPPLPPYDVVLPFWVSSNSTGVVAASHLFSHFRCLPFGFPVLISFSLDLPTFPNLSMDIKGIRRNYRHEFGEVKKFEMLNVKLRFQIGN
ncbi:hypothetical protein L2E82_02640 [Cichorium intybus]|uniref:Uncharacterized protein n=1 Tax=Cichorium intybus TaxID=13427 RepID=A0ACB9H3I0_CICIN|nr:hypothetical protein L2E82_02640 [Cichorium intybus]